MTATTARLDALCDAYRAAFRAIDLIAIVDAEAALIACVGRERAAQLIQQVVDGIDGFDV